MSIAYLANSFPEALESYVADEISELGKNGAKVWPCSIRTPHGRSVDSGTSYVSPLEARPSVKATWLLIVKLSSVSDLLWRVVRGPESWSRWIRTLTHTWLGAYLALQLQQKRIRHIHVHHGYFGAWVGMVAARLPHAGFSMTLHGSDLLVRADYIDVKVQNCGFCITISEFNRQYILRKFPSVDPNKILVLPLGVDLDQWRRAGHSRSHQPLSILSVGRLHAVKNHAFLLLACHALKSSGFDFTCAIAGDGEERQHLEQLVTHLGLEREVKLFGEVPRRHLRELYGRADVFVLTSRSEGLPVALMEAMPMECIVIAPAITGIPEIVIDGETGFLYQQGAMEDFLAKLRTVVYGGKSLDPIRQAARRHIESKLDSHVNLMKFATEFLRRVNAPNCDPSTSVKEAYEDSVLQQI